MVPKLMNLQFFGSLLISAVQEAAEVQPTNHSRLAYMSANRTDASHSTYETM